MSDSKPVCSHDWETGRWGVIVGVSRCRICGVRSRSEDFARRRAAPGRRDGAMNCRVGTCSLCGGDVMGHRGPWLGVAPPPPDRCVRCRAVSASDIIPMVRPPHSPNPPEDGLAKRARSL